MKKFCLKVCCDCHRNRSQHQKLKLENGGVHCACSVTFIPMHFRPDIQICSLLENSLHHTFIYIYFHFIVTAPMPLPLLDEDSHRSRCLPKQSFTKVSNFLRFLMLLLPHNFCCRTNCSIAAQTYS